MTYPEIINKTTTSKHSKRNQKQTKNKLSPAGAKLPAHFATAV